MENLLFVVATIILIAVGIYAMVLLYKMDKEERASKRKTQIEIGKSVNDRFEEINRSLNRIEDQLNRNYAVSKTVHSCADKNRKKIEDIEKELDKISELLNKQQPEKKEEDNSPIWGILSGILSGALTSALLSSPSSKKPEKKEETQTQENKSDEAKYVIRITKSGEMVPDKEFKSLSDAYQWIADKPFREWSEYEVIPFEKPEETQE